jgi:hypothetical protein
LAGSLSGAPSADIGFYARLHHYRRRIRRFLNHSGGDVTDHYIRDSALGQLQLAEQETISAHIIKALGSPRGLAR